MHRDKRLGLAMGVLIIAIVGAFFFRIKPTSHNSLPPLVEQEKLDQAIAQLPSAPYLKGLEADNNPIALAKAKPRFHQNPPQWEMPEFLKTDSQLAEINSSALPDPIQRDSDVPAISVVHRKEVQPDKAAVTPDNSADHSEMPAIDVFAKEYANDLTVAPPRTYPKARPYRVQQGDTLTKLAEKYLGSNAHYMEIYRINRGVLKSPDDLQAGMIIRIPLRKRTSAASKNSGDSQPQTVDTDKDSTDLFETLPIAITVDGDKREQPQVEQPLQPEQQKQSSTGKYQLRIEGSKPLTP